MLLIHRYNTPNLTAPSLHFTALQLHFTTTKKNAHLIDSFIVLFFTYHSYMFQRKRLILRELSLGASQVT
jgi:hypothetical protein